MTLALKLSLTLRTAVQPTASVLRLAGMFGLGIDEDRDLAIIPPTDLTLEPGQVIFITGASGSGKSSLLRLMAEALAQPPHDQAARVLRFESLPPLPELPLVDCFAPLPLERVTSLLALAGLGDAFVMLRKPSELSDGQRYRLRLAQCLAIQELEPAPVLTVILADEFGATLDRLTASIIARNVRKWTRKPSAGSVCFIAATTHDDLLESLEPDVLIEKHLGERLDVHTRSHAPAASALAVGGVA